jgi:ABC-type multidrug transport system ATPase subunit
MLTEPIIKVRELTKQFKDVRALDRLDMTVFPGDVYGFLGPNGSGKSTTIRILLSLASADAGFVEIFGEKFPAGRFNILNRIGALVEKPDFYEYLDAYKQLELLLRYSGYEAGRNRIMEALDLVGLKDRAFSKIKTYSKGMKQRLGIAQAIVHDPELIILDEPVSGLDPAGIRDIRNLIIHLNRDLKKTIVLSSHLLYEVEIIANRMIIINKGKAIVEGNVKELLNTFDVRTIIKTNDNVLAISLLKESGIKLQDIEYGNDGIVFHCKRESISLVNNYLVGKGLMIESIHQVQSLEDYFMNLT